ncbi:MAG: DUF402 domain-containing protein [Chloroflexi bacterium]|nr:DUF402 domain-containing protein [Chloroflexota bacterium]
MNNPVTTRKLKFDGTAKAPWEGHLVEAIGDRWLVVYYEAPPHRTETGETIAHALRYFGMDCPLSVLACFDATGRVLEWQADAGLPSRIDGRTIDFVDLDIDLMVDAAGRSRVRDILAFERNRRAMAYSQEAVTAAHSGIRLAQELFAARECPFDGSAEAILGRVLAAQGPL